MSIMHTIMSFLQLKTLVIWLATFILISKLVHLNMFRYMKYCRNLIQVRIGIVINKFTSSKEIHGHRLE